MPGARGSPFTTKTGPKRHQQFTHAKFISPIVTSIAGRPAGWNRCLNKRIKKMKRIFAVLLPFALCASAAFAFDDDDSVVRWRTIVGVITSQGVDSPVGNIHSGATAWSARSGRAIAGRPVGWNRCLNKRIKKMKRIFAVLLPFALCASAAFAFDDDDSVVRWR